VTRTGYSPFWRPPSSTSGGTSLDATFVTNISGDAPVVTLTADGGSQDVPVGDVMIDTLGMWTAPNNSFYALTVQQTGLYLVTANTVLSVISSTYPTTGFVSFGLYSQEIGDLSEPTLSWEEWATPSGHPTVGGRVGINCSVLAWLSSGYYIEWFGANWTDVNLRCNGLSQNSLGATLIHT